MLRRLQAKHPGTPLPRVACYEFLRQVFLLVLMLVYRIRWFGLRNVPASGPVLLVANHQSYLDPPVIGSPLSHLHLDFVARKALFGSQWFGWLISSLNATPIKDDGRGDAGAIKEVLRRLEAGRAVLIFPEGSRSHDGAIAPFKRGVEVLVKRSRCPVVPVAIEGCYDAWPRSRARPWLWGRRVAVMYGEPIGHEELMADGAEAGLERLRVRIDSMRRELRGLLRRATHGRYPPRGAGDAPLAPTPVRRSSSAPRR
jgi:1-acyl-sn-glycerol-3-phosphate acyltransferase